MNYTEWDWAGASALVMGGEGRDCTVWWRKIATPWCVLLLGKIESLNVPVAAGVILYEAVRPKNTGDRRQETGRTVTIGE
jgi:tRNA G18 (ribose-2'-O)-methylase SpoU